MILWKCCPGVPPLWFSPNLATDHTPFMCCACLLSVAWVWAQWDVRVLSSSRGAHCGVVHSPSDLLYHRCHCCCRDFVLFVDCRGVCVMMSCGGPDGAYNSIWDSLRPFTGNTSVISCTKTLLSVFACSMTVQQLRRGLRRHLHLFPVQVAGRVSQ